MSTGNPYETDALVSQYNLFHYGEKRDILPYAFGPNQGWNYPVDCAQLLLSHHTTDLNRALDLGCAVGRSSFELARRAHYVLGVDFSQRFIEEANSVKETGTCTMERIDEGEMTTWVEAKLDPAIERKRVHFRVGDACALDQDLGSFDAVLMANLIDRLHTPTDCLSRLADLLRPGGTLVITSPYTWLEEYTPKDNWLGGRRGPTLEGLKKHLAEDFTLVHTRDLPFLIREHARKFQWSVAQASVWTRR